MLREMNVNFQHIFQEGNSSTDYLAKIGSESLSDHWVFYEDNTKLISGF